MPNSLTLGDVGIVRTHPVSRRPVLMQSLAQPAREEGASESTSADTVNTWQAAARAKLNEITNLPEGWDSYQARTISRHTAMFALEILDQFMGQMTPLPNIVPSSVGGIQLEWHEPTVRFELHIAAPYDVEFYFEDRLTGDATEAPLRTTDLSSLQKHFASLG